MDGTLTVAVGASRSGKTAWVKQQLADPGRYLIQLYWDVEGQYEGNVIRTRSQLVDVCAHAKPGRWSYRPRTLADFGFWGECGLLLLRVAEKRYPDRVHTAIVAEETSDVTSPGKAPDGWGMLVRRGLKRAGDIYAITQRPSESDKTVMGNAGVIHCCGLQRDQDMVYMSKELRLPVPEIAGLDRSKLEYVHKDMRTGEVIKGRLTF